MQGEQFLQFKEKQEKIFNVSEFLDFLNNQLLNCRAIVQGEVGEKISDYKNRGFAFFDLLDKKGSILKCFVWRDKIENLGIELEAGMEIRVIGYPEVRKKNGELKFQVERIELVGEGDLKRAFEALKNKLEVEGLFSLENKKPIPYFCQKIGLITSKYGKGAKPDFEKHLGKFGFEIYFYDVRVEGSFAIEEIVNAIRWFNENMPTLDVLVLIRGGGSWESLQAFNSEPVARAIFASNIPIICGVGHESDVTIADLVADLRASTPTDAAKILNENWKMASETIKKYEKNIISVTNRFFKTTKERIGFFEENISFRIKEKISSKEEKINILTNNLKYFFQNYFQKIYSLETIFKLNFEKVKNLIQNHKLEINENFKEITKNAERYLQEMNKILRQEEDKLKLTNPFLKLKQGYSISYDKNKKIIKNTNNLKIGEEIKTKFYKGEVLSKIKKVE